MPMTDASGKAAVAVLEQIKKNGCIIYHHHHAQYIDGELDSLANLLSCPALMCTMEKELACAIDAIKSPGASTEQM